MAGPLDRSVSRAPSAPRVEFTVARPEDDPVLRALLRDNPMGKNPALSLEREPRYADGDGLWPGSRTVLAREFPPARRPVGLYQCQLGPVHLNGRPVDAGYLGGLRVEPAFRRRLSVLKAGYDSIRALVPWDRERVWFTSLAADNRAARRLLERGLDGLPRYRPVGELETFVFDSRLGRSKGLWRPAVRGEVRELAAFVNRQNAEFHFSPVLSAEDLLADRAGLSWRLFHVFEEGGEIRAALAPWDQRAYKQAVVRGYAGGLKTFRPLLNAIHRIMRLPPWPAVGEPWEGGFLAFFAVHPGERRRLGPLIREGLYHLRRRGCGVGYWGLSPENPLRKFARRLPHLSYRTVIETVRWPDSDLPGLDERPVQPEAALL